MTLSYGTNCWATIPHSDDMLSAGFNAFLTIVRQGHATTPVIVVSPIVRPSAETTPNRLGATLQSLRAEMEEVVRSRIAAGDRNLVLVHGRSVVPEERLADGIHPDDEGHGVLADALSPLIGDAVLRATEAE